MPSFGRERYSDRRAAGRRLAEELGDLAGTHPVVLGLARGGVPVAAEVATALGAELDVLVVRKLGAPGNPEFAFGALAEGGGRYLNQATVRSLGISEAELAAAIAHAEEQIDARVQRFRSGRSLELADRLVLVVDDGLATGATARAALRAVRAQHPARLVLAVPVGAPETVDALAVEADEVICPVQPVDMWAVGAWYEHFGQVSDDEVVACLTGAPAADPPRGLTEHAVRIPIAGGAELSGDLRVPPRASGLVLFAHGSGSSRMSPRNRDVAAALNAGGLATLLFDLLTAREGQSRAAVFDIALLADRLMAATSWAERVPETAGLPIGFFGASTGAAAALWAAAELGPRVRTVVSRGGRPDLALERLGAVGVPVLLIVGSRDEYVLQLNREAKALVGGACELAIVPGATHLFEEPGTLERVAQLAADWFVRHLAGATPAGGK